MDADEKTLTDSYERWVEEYIGEGTKREKIWTESIAAGSVKFIEGVKARLGLKAKCRRIRKNGNGQNAVYALQEPIAAYNADFEGKNVYPMKSLFISSGAVLRDENRLLWKVFTDV